MKRSIRGYAARVKRLAASILRGDGKPDSDSQDFVENVLGTNYGRKALLSYITAPYRGAGIAKSHTNYLECATWVECLGEIGYDVDLVGWIDALPPEAYGRYALVTGLGRSFYESLRSPGANNRKHVFYGTMAYPPFSNALALKRILQIRNEGGPLLLDSCRLLPDYYQIACYLADKLIVVGNEFTRQTYARDLAHVKIERINLFFHRSSHSLSRPVAPMAARKCSILWFGSGGLLHKGLDIAIECARRHREIHLHVCGTLAEREFQEYFLAKAPENTSFHGFVDIESERFSELVATCGALLYPSLSEGQAGSVLTVCGNASLVPIITRNSGLDESRLGFEIEEPTLESTLRALSAYLATDESRLSKMAEAAQAQICRNHSYEGYRSDLRASLAEFGPAATA